MFFNNTKQNIDNRLAVLHIIATFERPINKQELTDFIIENELMDYFQVQEVLLSLLDGGLIKEVSKDQEKGIVITENGRVSLSFFKDRLPLDLLNTISDLVALKIGPAPKENEIGTDIKTLEDGMIEVNLFVIEDGLKHFSISLLVATENQAVLIAEKWHEKAESAYGDIMAILTTNKTSPS